MAQPWPARSIISRRSLTWRALATSSGMCSRRERTVRSHGLLMTVSMRRALPCFRYCLTRLCL